MSINNGEQKLANDKKLFLGGLPQLPPPFCGDLPPPTGVPAPWELPPPGCPLPFPPAVTGVPHLTHEQAIAFQKQHLLAQKRKKLELEKSIQHLPKVNLPDNLIKVEDDDEYFDDEYDLRDFSHVEPIRADLVIEGLPDDVEQELEAQKRKRRVLDEPIDPSLPPTKRQKLERMKKNRESAQKSREKKARHKAMLSEQVKLLSMKNNELTKAIGLLTSQATECSSLRKTNHDLQKELYEVKLHNERLKTMLAQNSTSRQQGNTINITNCLSSTSKNGKATGVTETSNSTGSAVGEEASLGVRENAKSSGDGSNMVSANAKWTRVTTKQRQQHAGHGALPTSAEKTKSCFSSFEAFMAKFSSNSKIPTGAFGASFGDCMAGFDQNKPSIFNDLLENGQRPIPDVTGAMGLPPLFRADGILPPICGQLNSPMAPVPVEIESFD